MLTNVRAQIQQEEMTDVLEGSMSVTSDKVRSAFLDELGTELLGAENDPEIKALIEQIPEYDDHDENLELAVETETLKESIFETNY